jgi:hypothetical protein
MSDEQPARLTEAGVCYDALHALGELLQAQPSSADALRQRADSLARPHEEAITAFNEFKRAVQGFSSAEPFPRKKEHA